MSKSKSTVQSEKKETRIRKKNNKAGYTATPVTCAWAGALFDVTKVFGQEQ